MRSAVFETHHPGMSFLTFASVYTFFALPSNCTREQVGVTESRGPTSAFRTQAWQRREQASREPP